MHTKTYVTTIAISLFFILFLLVSGCVTDPIKSVKNNPDKMNILMNHIAHDDAFREQMIDKLLKSGDRQKMAEQFIQEEDVARMLLSKIIETEKGKQDIINRVGNRKELITKAISKSLALFEYREILLDTLLLDEGMVEFMRDSEKLKKALEE
jgi:PBP1b-binding outer membrane lipoprotein LpoB